MQNCKHPHVKDQPSDQPKEKKLMYRLRNSILKFVECYYVMKYTAFTFSFWHMQMKKFLVWLQYGKADSSMLKCEKWQRFLKEEKKKNPSEYWWERVVWAVSADLIGIDVIFLSYPTKKITSSKYHLLWIGKGQILCFCVTDDYM